MATDLAGLLADADVRGMKRMTPGHSEKVLCPKCEGGNTHEKSLSVTIDVDGQGATWNCKRGSCGATGGGRIEGAQGDRQVEPARRIAPPPIVAPADQTKPRSLYAWFAKRGITAETVDAFGVYMTKRHFPELGERPAIVFPFLVGGRVVNRKFRPPEKNPQLQEKDALPSLFNVDAIVSPDVVVWVEGEPDVMVAHQCGYPQTVTLPNGAPAANVKHDDKRYLPLETHAELLVAVQKFILAGDMDTPGLALREELARRLGRHRCWLVTWPEDCKDANDTLLKHSAAMVQQCIELAEPYPIRGVQLLQGDTLLKLRALPPPSTMSTGCGATDRIIHLPTEGRLIVVSGIPNHGKTSWVRFVMVHTMEHHNRRWAVFSPEMQPWQEFVTSCVEVFDGKLFYADPALPLIPVLTDEEVQRAEAWFKRRLVMLVSDAEDEPPTLDWLIERARLCCVQYGITDLLIDPWNEIEHSRGDMSETEYIGRGLQRLKAFGLRHGCNVWIVAHPRMLAANKATGKVEAPSLYDISGSSNWANKPDLAVVIHTPSGENTQAFLRKSRFRRFGMRGAMAEMAYAPGTGRYSTPPEGPA